MTKFNNKYIKKSQRDGLSEVLDLVKNRKHYSALRKCLFYMDKEQRLQFSLKLFKDSRYRAYFGGILELEEVIRQYLSSKNLNHISNFISVLEKRQMETRTINSFDTIRMNLLLDLLNDKGEYTFQGILSLYNYDVLFGEEDFDKFLPLIVDICQINWPDNPAIKVLFGR